MFQRIDENRKKLEITSTGVNVSDAVTNKQLSHRWKMSAFAIPESLENSLEFGDVRLNKCAVTPLIIDQTLFIKQCFPPFD